MTMNPLLAEMYGTQDNIGTASYETEKVASAAVLEEAQALDGILANEGIDIDSLSGDTISKVAESVFGPESVIAKMAESDEDEDDEEEEPEEAEEKMAEADFLGRQMAHAYVDELASIEKDAAVPQWAKDAPKWVADKFRAAGGAISSGAKSVSKAPGKLHEKAQALGKRVTPEKLKELARESGKASYMKKNPQHRLFLGRSAGEGRRKALETALGYGAGVGGIGAAGAGAYGAHKGLQAAYGGKSKKSSADWFESAAADYANEILKQAGVAEDLDEEKVAEAINERAWQMLDEAGYLE